MARLKGPLPEPKLTRKTTALLCVDLQYGDTHPDFGLSAKAKQLGMQAMMEPFWERVRALVIPNIRRLQATAREREVEVVHVRVASRTRDGRDGTPRYRQNAAKRKVAGLRDSKEAQILPEVGPVGDEIAIDKTTSGLFNSTTADMMLRNMGIRNLIIFGVSTNGCVESTTRGAAELGYNNILVEDACAALLPELHENSVLSMSIHNDAFIRKTAEVIRLLKAL